MMMKMRKKEQNDQNDFFEDIKNKGKGKFAKCVASALVLSAMSIWYLEDAGAKFDSATIAQFARLKWVLGELMTSPPVDFPTPAPGDPSLVQSNIELANLLAKAVASPLANIAAVEIRRLAGAAHELNPATTTGAVAAAQTAVTNFVAAPSAPGVAPVAPIALAGAPVAWLPASLSVLVAGVAGSPQSVIACAILIVATAKAVCSAGGVGAPGLTQAAINAASAASVNAVGGSTLGRAFQTAIPANILNTARALVDAYVGTGGAMAASPTVAALTAVYTGGAPGIVVDTAHELLSHIIERAHFWRNVGGLPPTLTQERHFLAWARGARAGLEATVPLAHCAFLVPVAGTPEIAAAGTGVLPAGNGRDAVTHLHSLLAAANAAYPGIAANTCLTWNGNRCGATGDNIGVGAVAALTGLAAAGETVGIHLALGGGHGTLIKCDLKGSPGQNHLSEKLVREPTVSAAETQAQRHIGDAAATLGEAAATAELLGTAGIPPAADAAMGAYLVPLGGAVVATPAANAPLNRVTLLINRKEGIGTMFPE
jgi:hypothetical protein